MCTYPHTECTRAHKDKTKTIKNQNKIPYLKSPVPEHSQGTELL